MAATVESDPIVIELGAPTDRRSRLTGREGVLWVIAAAVLMVTGILKGINLVLILAYVLLGLWAINVVLARRSVRGLSAKRPPRPPITAGLPTEWPIDVSQVGPAGGNWILEERAGDNLARWLTVRLGDGSFRVRVRATFPRRGKTVLAPLTARSAFPFGLYTRSIPLLAAEDLVVLPRPARVDGDRLRAWLFRSWSGREAERRKRRRIVEREAEIHGLRDYRSGDPPRHIHWKATARRQKLTVREFEDASPPRLLLVVEPWLPIVPTPADREAIERVISLAAGVVREWRREAGARLTLVLAGPTPAVLDGPPGSGLTERMLIALALEPGGPTGDMTVAIGSLSRAAFASPALVISTRADPPIRATIGGGLDRPVAIAHVGRTDAWYQMP